MHRPLTRIFLVLCLTLLASPRAWADDPAERASKRHFERGQKLFALQKFDEALAEYQKAFDANPIPDFLFNVGQCQRSLGDYQAAIFSFKRFLKLDPETPDRDKVEGLIAELEQRLVEDDTRRLRLDKRRDRDRGPETEPGSPVYKKWWFWTGIAVVGVAGGVGIYAATRTDGPPATDLGNVDFDK
jgi:tetratricopeptide (TPR) repeat protein